MMQLASSAARSSIYFFLFTRHEYSRQQQGSARSAPAKTRPRGNGRAGQEKRREVSEGFKRAYNPSCPLKGSGPGLARTVAFVEWYLGLGDNFTEPSSSFLIRAEEALGATPGHLVLSVQVHAFVLNPDLHRRSWK